MNEFRNQTSTAITVGVLPILATAAAAPRLEGSPSWASTTAS